MNTRRISQPVILDGEHTLIQKGMNTPCATVFAEGIGEHTLIQNGMNTMKSNAMTSRIGEHILIQKGMNTFIR